MKSETHTLDLRFEDNWWLQPNRLDGATGDGSQLRAANVRLKGEARCHPVH